MIWPWSEIRKWKEQAQRYETLADDRAWKAERFRAEYMQVSKEMRGAHKGIWRLKKKLNEQTIEIDALRHTVRLLNGDAKKEEYS